MLLTVCVVVLAQNRPMQLRRLLESLNGTDFSVEIKIDRLKPRTMFPSNDLDLRVVKVAKRWSSKHHNVKVEIAERWMGVRGMWLSVNASLERHTLIVEDDVVLSPAWLDFLRSAPRIPSSAGVSLQRQRHRLDINGKLGRLDIRDGLYLFPHVGSWAFSPDPFFWRDFVDWFLRHSKKVPPIMDSIVQKWYRDSLRVSRRQDVNRGLPDSMWTAHFDWFCHKKRRGVLHASIGHNRYALATSYRSRGEHYNIDKPDSILVDMELWHQTKDSLLASKITFTDLTGAGRRNTL